MKALLLSSTGFGHGSMAPFKYYATELKQRFNLTSNEITSDYLKHKLRDIKNFNGELIFVSVPWSLDRFEVLDFFKEASNYKKKAKLIFFDYGDGNESKFWDSMPYIDLYLKQYLYRDMNKYQNNYIGASEFVEYLVKNGLVKESIESEIWTHSFQSHLLPEYYNKVILGWNFALWKRMLYLADGSALKVLWHHDKLHKRLITLCRRAKDIMLHKITGNVRPIDVYCRSTLYSGWTKYHRTATMKLLNQLPRKYKIISSTKKVGFSEYYREMALSKIFVSPSGWCEYTPKDYEAMVFGTLLIKPCVEHIDTEPDVLIPNQTYISVKWDMSDLKEKCIYYLENSEERKKITQNAKNAILGYYKDMKFLDKIEEILDKLNVITHKK
jgi:hypothetical protein